MGIYRTIQHRTRQQVADAHKLRPKSSKREDIIDFLLQKDFVSNYVNKLEWKDNYDLLPDEIQDIWLSILEIPQERWNDLYEQGTSSIVAFISGMIFRQIKSNTSPIYHRYKKPLEHELIFSKNVWDVYDQTGEMPKDLLPTEQNSDDYYI